MATGGTSEPKSERSPEEGGEQVSKLLQHYLDLADDLCHQCRDLIAVHGMRKLLKKCQSELKFLNGLKTSNPAQQETHLRSSNLSHLQGIVGCVTSTPDVQNVLQPFHCKGVAHSLVVDVVGNHGYTWVKVIARKAQALHLVWAGGGQFGEKSIVEQAHQYIECSKQNLHNYTPPQVVFRFLQGVTPALQTELVSLGITVEGDVHQVNADTQRKVQMVKDAMMSDEEDDEYGYHDDGDDELELIDEDGVWRMATPEETAARLKEKALRQEATKDAKSGGQCHLVGETSQTLVDKTTTRGHDDPNLQPAPSISESQSRQFNLGCDKLTSSSSSPSSHVTVENTTIQRSSSSASVDSSMAPSRGLPSHHSEDLPVNLDVSTLICLASNICHGHANYVFEEPILSQQAEQERASPLLPKLQEFMRGKDLLVCETAIKSFNSILHLIGGPAEQERAARLLQGVRVVPDSTSKVMPLLQQSAKVKKRAQVIFSTGYELRAITMTANHGFVRATRNQGVSFAVFLHESRALTEMKQAGAKVFVSEGEDQS